MDIITVPSSGLYMIIAFKGNSWGCIFSMGIHNMVFKGFKSWEDCCLANGNKNVAFPHTRNCCVLISCYKQHWSGLASCTQWTRYHFLPPSLSLSLSHTYIITAHQHLWLSVFSCSHLAVKFVKRNKLQLLSQRTPWDQIHGYDNGFSEPNQLGVRFTSFTPQNLPARSISMMCSFHMVCRFF